MSIDTRPFWTPPLEGVTVVSLEQVVAAPFARGYDETVDGMASRFVRLNRSEESLALDIESVRAATVARWPIVYPKAR